MGPIHKCGAMTMTIDCRKSYKKTTSYPKETCRNYTLAKLDTYHTEPSLLLWTQNYTYGYVIADTVIRRTMQIV